MARSVARPLILAMLAAWTTACPNAAAGPLPPEGPEGLNPPPEVLPDAAVSFAVRPGVHDEMIARSPELANARRSLELQGSEFDALHEIIRTHLSPAQAVYGAVVGPSEELMRTADTKLHASDDLITQAFALDRPLGQHIRLYIPTTNASPLVEALVDWAKDAYTSSLASFPDRPCVAEGSAVCIESMNRFIAITDEGWGVRVDVAATFWPTLDLARVIESSGYDGEQRATIVEALQARGLDDLEATTRTMRESFWNSAYEAPGLESAPMSPEHLVLAHVDPHATLRLATAFGLGGQYYAELSRALRRLLDPSTDEHEASFEIPSLEPASEDFPFSTYTAQWSFDDDARMVEFEWTLREEAQRRLEGRSEHPMPSANETCQGTSACIVATSSLSGLLDVDPVDPAKLTPSPEQRHFLLPIAAGAWPNILASLRASLPIDPVRLEGALAAAVWSGGWGHLEFAAGSWTAPGTEGTAIQGTDDVLVPVEGGTRHYLQNGDFVVVDPERTAPASWIAASSLDRASWLSGLPVESPVGPRMTIELSDLLAAQRRVLGTSASSRWGSLTAEFTRAGAVVRGRVVFKGRRKEVVQ